MARLACFDLDNTLIDRDGAFLAWARWWGSSRHFPDVLDAFPIILMS